VLDSRYLGVPQRRRRVFILARRSRGRRASEVLLEPESGGGDFEAGAEARAGVAERSEERPDDVGALQAKRGYRNSVQDAAQRHLIARSLTAETGQRNDATAQNLIPEHYYIEGFEDGTLTAAGQDGGPPRSDRTPLISTSPDPDGVRAPSGVPRGMDYRCAHDPKPDGPRYAACGDAVTANVAEWIGRRLIEHG
jgi:site-specific DNA-cytosine methylase